MSTSDKIKRHLRVPCPLCGAAVGKPCDGTAITSVHARRSRAHRAAFPSGRVKGKRTAPDSRPASVRVPSTEYARVKAWLPGAVKLFLDGK